LQNVTTDLRLAEERLNTTAEISRQFEDSLQVADEAKQAFKRTEEQLTACLEASAQALSEADGRLKKETSERQELAKTVESLQRQLQQETEKSKLEISRLQAALQVEKLERTQNEGKAVQTRYASIESARADRILLARLRTRTRGPMDELLRSTRRLLEDELDENRKKLVESMLEQALLLKSNFLEGADAIETSYTPVEA
jgi:undecaprenyl pyrophosphate synthase